MKEQKAEEILALVDAKADRLAEEMIDKMLGIAQETAVTEEKQGTAVARGRYQYSFVAKLHQSADNVKAYYSRLKNLLLAYGWKSRGSWANESFYSGRKTHAKMGFSGKKLTLYLALNPADFKESKYYFKDVSARVKYASVPMAVSVKSTRGVKWAEELTVAMATALGKGKTEYTEQDFRLPYIAQKQLLAKGLIKEKFLTEESAELQAVSEKAEGLYQEPAPAVRVSLKRKNRKR